MLAARVWRTLGTLGLLFAAGLAGCKGEEAAEGRPFLYVAGEQNITWYSFDDAEGTLTKKDSLALGLTAAFIAKSLDGKHLYALLRTNGADEKAMMDAGEMLEGYVVTYSIKASNGALKEVSRVPSAGGRPTYITLDKSGKYVFVANNLGHLPNQGKSISVFEVKEDGTLNEAHQTLMAGLDGAGKPFIRSHQIRVHPSNKYVYVPNIDSDNVSQFLFDEKTGELEANDPPAVQLEGGPDNAPQGGPSGIFFGPRHLDFSPDGKWVFLSNEYSAQVSVFAVKADGALEVRGDPVRGVPEDFDGVKWQSEIRVHPTGKFVYVGQRDKRQAFMDPAVDPNGQRQDSMAVFAVDQKTGALTLKANVPTDKTPRNFVLAPSGNWLVLGNQDSNSLTTFRIDEKGMLKKASGVTGQKAPYVHMFVTLP